MTQRSARTTAFARRALAALAVAAQLSGALASGVSLPRVPALPNISEALIIHDSAGIAMLGFDPVAYFAEGRARGGLARHELQHGGYVWRFASSANLAAFEARPDAYTPAFGGHDAAAMAVGRAVESEPRHFAIVEDRLFLFRTAESRQRFAADPGMAAEADRRWAEVERQLAR
jgi:hypothetical protein